MLLPACAKARGISPSTSLMTPGCRPEDICHCVSLEEERTGRPWAPPPPPQLGTPLSKGDQGRRAHLPLRVVLPRPAGVLKGASSQTCPQSWSGVRTPGLAPVASAT